MSSKKKVAIIGTVGLPANYGGFETMIKYLTEQKSDVFDFTVFCQKIPKDQQLKEYNGSKLKYLPFLANGPQSIVYDIVAIIMSWFKYDTLLILGTPGCIILPLLNIFKKTRTIINFGGLEWARDKWGILGKIYLKFTEQIAVSFATNMVADNQYFCNYLRKTYGKKSSLIEYGGDHAQRLAVTEALMDKYPFLCNSYDVSVSRAQVDNNLHLLLETYSKTPQRQLVLISNYSLFEYGRQLKEKYKVYSNLWLQDAIYDKNELDVIRSNAQLYIHSHSFCGTAPSLVEAMSLRLPVIAYNVPTNHYTTEEMALYFNDENELEVLIESLTDNKIEKLATQMYEIAKRRYIWKRISNKYGELF